MKVFTRGFGLALVMGSFVALIGCSSSNESEADKLQKGLGAVPTTTVKGGEPAKEHTTGATRKDPMTIQNEYRDSKVGGKK